jgi:hypothetical protein
MNSLKKEMFQPMLAGYSYFLITTVQVIFFEISFGTTQVMNINVFKIRDNNFQLCIMVGY